MANRYWVGGTGSWTAANTANWSATSNGAGGASVPTAADDVFVNASSGGGTLTIATNVALAKSLDFTGFTGNLVLNQGFTLSGGLTLGASMGTITGGGYFYTFSATTDNGGAGWPINMNGKAFPSGSASTFAFSGVGGKWVLQGNANFGTSQINVSSGTFDTGNYNVTASGITSNSALARTLTFGSSAITVTAQANPWLIGGSAPTITANTAVVTVTGNTNGVAMGSINYNGLSLVFNNQSTQAVVFTGHFAVRSITFTGSATKFGGASFAGNVVCTDSFVVNGNSAVNRFLVTSTQAGNVISINTPSVTLNNVDFMDISAVGAAAPWTGTSLGDCLGNSGITFPAGATQYYVTNASSNWSDTSKWASSSGGTGGTGRVPLPQDDVRFDANSVTAGGRIISIDMPRIGCNIDLTGAGVNSPTLAPALSTTTMYGSLTWAAGVTAGQSSSPWVFAGRGTHTITMNGVAPLNWAMSLVAPGGSYSLGGALAIGGNAPGVFNALGGTFNTNNYTMVVGSFGSGGTTTRAVNLGTSTITLTAAAGNWTISGSGLIMSATSATIAYGASASARSFAGNGFTYGTLDYSIANSSGSLDISGGNTFGTVNIGPGRAFNLATAAIHTIGDFNATGQVNGYQYLNLVANDRVSLPDAAPLQITGDIDVRADLAADSWSTPTGYTIVAKDSGTTTTRAWGFQYQNGFLKFVWWDSGGTLRSTQSSVVVPFSAGQRGRVRATLDVNDGAGGHAVRFWTSPSGGAPVWTQLGSSVSVGAFTTSIRNGATPVDLNVGGGGRALTGKWYSYEIRNNILDDGSGIVASVDFTTKPFGSDTFTESSANAATVTLIGNATVGDGRVAVSSATNGTPTLLTLPGDRRNYDYLVVKDVLSTIPYKFYAGANSIDVSGNTNVILATTPTDDPFIVFDAEVNLNGTLTNTINLTIPPGQSVLTYDHIVLIFHSTNVHAGAAAPGLTAVSPASVSDVSATTSILTGLASGGETGKVVTHTSGGLAGTIRLLVVRGAANVEGVASAVGGNVSTTTASTGTLSSSLPASIAIASVGAAGTLGATLANSNGFQQARVLVAETGNYLRVSAKPLPTPGSVTTSTTWTTAQTRNVGRLLILRPDSNGVLQSSFMPFFG